MKFRNSIIRNPGFSREIRINTIGRFGNYFFTHGWISGDLPCDGIFEYVISGRGKPLVSEFTFFHPAGQGDLKIYFLNLFWVDNGYQLDVSHSNPLVLSIREPTKGGAASAISIHEIHDVDLDVFVRAIKAMENKDIWTNRLVLEIARRGNLKYSSGFYSAALEVVDLEVLDAAFWKLLEQGKEGGSARSYIQFLCQCISFLDTRYMPTPLQAKFIALVDDFLLSENDLQLAHDILRQLARMDRELSIRYAIRVITSLKHDRKELAVCLRHSFPQDSRWWIHHMIVNPELGVEQIADALNCAGTAAASQGNPALAMLSYEAASTIDPAAQSVAWNAGCFLIEQGDVERAKTFFKRVCRHFPNESLSTRWPHVRDSLWPAAAANVEGFKLPAGVDAWPRITVITPSYNQGGFIEETILSVLNQCYPNLQYIVVDGNSMDDTRKILAKYENRFDHLIVEPDNGQTEAINKGLRLADGELIAWMNSDDMYAPGALHIAALKWLENHADVIAGICIEHVDRRMILLNKPAAADIDFNPSQLAKIFKYWLKGHYFYQPEVFFSKRILDSVGLLDESLYYSMDYDLWMRFAKAGATLEVVDWPFAFFRKHDQQKTTDLVNCVEEQARVRSRHHALVPDEERSHRIRRNLSFLRKQKHLTVGILTKRLGKIFSRSMQHELDRFCRHGVSCYLGDDEKDPRIAEADIVILLVHVVDDPKTIKILRKAKPDRLIAAWFWDNHHHLFENYAAAEAVDVVLPGHSLYSEYLRNENTIHGDHIPLCVTQWSRIDAAGWFDEFGTCLRSSDLYGGFVEYVFEPARTNFLHKVRNMLPQHALSILSETNLNAYFGLPEKERFADWCRYQTSLVLPLRDDLSQRVFDALLAGQIPLVPEEISDLDSVISKDLQESLPILRFRMKDPASVISAHQKALQEFARDGAAGALARHRYALENHTFSSRINSILGSLGVTDI